MTKLDTQPHVRGLKTQPVGISQAATVIECHALVPLLVKVPRWNGSLARASNLGQEATAISCEPESPHVLLLFQTFFE